MSEGDDKRAPRVMVYVLLGLSVLTGLGVVTSSVFMRVVDSAREPGPAAIAAPEFKAPMLEVAEGEVLVKVRAEANKVLTRYEWVDKNSGLARIPIETAMRVMAATGTTAGGRR